MDQYSSIFRYLFPIKSVQMQISRSWKTLNQLFRNKILSKRDRKLMLLRQKMAFFIDNLLAYFHIDVLEIQWASLQESIKNVKGKPLRPHLQNSTSSVSTSSCTWRTSRSRSS